MWSAGSVGWNTSCAWDRKHVYYVFFAFYSLADVKAAVHEDEDGKLVLIAATVFLMMTPALQTLHAGGMKHFEVLRAPCAHVLGSTSLSQYKKRVDTPFL